MRWANPNLSLALVFFCSLFLSACRSSHSNFSRVINEPAPLPSTTRASFGRMALLPAAASAQFSSTTYFGNAQNTPSDLDDHEAAASAAFGIADVGAEMGLGSHNLEDLTLFGGGGLAIGVVTFGILETKAACVTALDAMQTAEARQSEQSLRKVVRDLPMQSAIHSHLSERFARQPHPALVSLTQPGIDSLLTLQVSGPYFVSDGLHALTLRMTVKSRVTRIADHKVLHAGELEFQSARRSLSDWKAHDARRLRAELAYARDLLSDELIEQLFDSPLSSP